MRQHTAVIALFLFGGVFVLGLLALASTLGPGASQADDATMHNCPQPSRWAIAVWGGDDGTDADQAFATCSEGAVVAAYDLDPQTQTWSRWFAGRPDISNLLTLDQMQGVFALGGVPDVCLPNPDPATPDVQIIDQPPPFASITSPLTVSGQIAAFEANYQVAIFDAAGNPIVQTFGTAQAREPGELAPFSIDVEFDVDEPTPACLWVYEESVLDGSSINVGQIPLLLLPSP